MKVIHQQDQITVYQSALYMTNSIVLVTPELVLIVDPNWLPDEIETIHNHVNQLLTGRELYMLFTHSDYDHIIGYGAFSSAKVIASSQLRDQPSQVKEAILEDIRQFDDDYYIVRTYPIEYPQVDIAIEEDGYALEVGSTRLTFYLAPGHTHDGMITVVEPGGIVIAGDYLSNIEFPYIYHSSSDYLNTLSRFTRIIEIHHPQLLIPGHGDVATEQAEMQSRCLASEEYIVRLRKAVTEKDQETIHNLIIECPFPRNMRRYHDDNRKLLEEELSL